MVFRLICIAGFTQKRNNSLWFQPFSSSLFYRRTQSQTFVQKNHPFCLKTGEKIVPILSLISMADTAVVNLSTTERNRILLLAPYFFIHTLRKFSKQMFPFIIPTLKNLVMWNLCERRIEILIRQKLVSYPDLPRPADPTMQIYGKIWVWDQMELINMLYIYIFFLFFCFFGKVLNWETHILEAHWSFNIGGSINKDILIDADRVGPAFSEPHIKWKLCVKRTSTEVSLLSSHHYKRNLYSADTPQ